MQILRDPIWQFAGALLTLFGIAAAFLIFRAQRNKKSLSYKLLSNTRVLTVGEEIAGKLEILYSGSPVKNVNLCTLKIVNDGNVPIASADYERPLSFGFGDACHILSAEVIRQSPQTLRPQLRVEATRFYLEPLLLNRKDSLTVKLLIAQYDSIIEPDARIIGISAVRQVKDRRKLSASIVLSLSIITFIFYVILLLAYLFTGLYTGWQLGVLSIGLAVSMLLMSLSANYLQKRDLI